MKMNRFLILAMFGLSLLLGCGKPNEPESLGSGPDNSGGYKIVKRISTLGFAQDVVKKDNLLYIAQGEAGLMIIDASDTSNVQMLADTVPNLQGYSAKLTVKDSLVYIAAGSNGIFMIDVSDPAQPEQIDINLLNNVTVRNVDILGNYLFASISEHGFSMYNISIPLDPIYYGNVETAGYAHDLVVTSDTAYVLAACGELGLSIFNITQFQIGVTTFVGSCDTEGYAEAIVIDEDASIAYLACGTMGLQVVDYADTANISVIGSFDYGGYAKDLIVKDNKVYMTAELSGLHILDVSNPANIKLEGVVDTEFALGIEMDDQYIYVADEEGGLLLITKIN
jgi:hypothetical protein